MGERPDTLKKGGQKKGCDFSQNEYQKISGETGRTGKDRKTAPGSDGSSICLQSAALGVLCDPE